METNFFSALDGLEFSGSLQFSITKAIGGKIVVAILLQRDDCADNAKNIIPPLTLKGTAGELDTGFFERIAQPIVQASGLVDNIGAFMEQMERARKESAMERQKKETEKRDSSERDRKYREAMEKVDELERQGKHREAWMKVPEISQFPELEKEIRKRKSELSAKFSPDLFATASPQVDDIEEQNQVEQ